LIAEIIQNSDSLGTTTQTVVDSTSKVLNHITFDPSRMIDSGGLTISLVSYAVVFAALVILYFFFGNVAKVMNSLAKRKMKAKGNKHDLEEKDLTIPGEVAAAISMAIQLHYAEVHDFENTVLTIKKVQRPYSPWSSKLYGLREYPKK
jgi:glutaconyl-CoA/methylmalonyl-CoA decarboxylase subunit delta